MKTKCEHFHGIPLTTKVGEVNLRTKKIESTHTLKTCLGRVTTTKFCNKRCIVGKLLTVIIGRDRTSKS